MAELTGVAGIGAAPASRGAQTEWPSTATAWWAVVLLNGAYLVAFMDRIVLSLLISPIQADLRLDDTQIGLLTGIAFGLCYTLCGLPAGYLADRFSRRNLIAVGMVFWTGMTAACGLAGGFWTLFLARLGVGVGESVLHPAAASLIADFHPPQRRPRAFAAYMMAGALGTFVAFFFGGRVLRALNGVGPTTWPLVGQLQPWQATFILVSLPGLVLVALLLLTVKEPARRGLATAGEARPGPTAVGRFLSANRSTFLFTMFGAPLLLIGGFSLVSWLPPLFEREYGWSAPRTAVTFALTGGLSSIVGTLAMGWWTERLRRAGHPDATFRMCLFGGAALNGFAALAMLAPTAELAILGLTAASFFLLSPGLAAVACVNEISPNQMRAQIGALFGLVTGLVANSLGPFLVGLLTQRVFGDPRAVNLSLLTLFVICGGTGAVLVALGLRPYRSSVAAARAWSADG